MRFQMMAFHLRKYTEEVDQKENKRDMPELKFIDSSKCQQMCLPGSVQ